MGYGEGRIAEAVDCIKGALTSSILNTVEQISIFLYFNKDGQQPLTMQEMTALTDFIWAVYPDESIEDTEVKVSILAAGKELENG